MKLYSPKYYQKFFCIADKCKHSCCIGWEIDIDSDAMNKYRASRCDYAKTVLESINVSESPHFELVENERCPHLNERGLCEIILNMGEDAICNICREHPRFYNFSNLGKEVGIGMSCEEACRLILNSDDYDQIIAISNLDGEPEIIDFDALRYRETVYKILKDNTLDFLGKIDMIYDYFDIYLDEKAIIEAIESMEYLNLSHRDIFAKFTVRGIDAKIECKLARALAYFVYRHCSEAESIEDFTVSLSLCLLLTFLIASISDENNVYEMARTVSEEIEYSQDNIDLLKDLFYI